MTVMTTLVIMDMTMEAESINLFSLWCDGIVPVAMEQVSSYRYRVLLLVGEFDFCGVEVRIEFAANGQSRAGRGVSDETL